MLALRSDEGDELRRFAVVGSAHLVDIGWLARKLAESEKKFAREKPADVQVFL